MSYSESKTFTNIPLPKGINALQRLDEFANCLADDSVRNWFSGNHLLDGYTAWDYLAEEFASDDVTEFRSANDAKANLVSAIKECVSIRRDCDETYFQVYRDTKTYGDEVHAWIVREFLLDPELCLDSVQTCFVVYDSREGYSIKAIRVSLDDSRYLTSNPLL